MTTCGTNEKLRINFHKAEYHTRDTHCYFFGSLITKTSYTSGDQKLKPERNMMALRLGEIRFNLIYAKDLRKNCSCLQTNRGNARGWVMPENNHTFVFVFFFPV